MELFPAVPYRGWSDTLETMHHFIQLVGKVRLAESPRRNHWWNVAFHLNGRGITTRPMGLNPSFTIDFDLVDHRLSVDTIEGRSLSFPLPGLSVAGFHTELTRALASIGSDVDLSSARPFGLPDSDRRFADDTSERAYDAAAVTRYWQVLSQVNIVLEEFSARFSGKISPVHHFWHGLDMAVTRFSDRTVDHAATTDAVTREGYSREVISSGFWFGDPTYPRPAFYSYTSPEPESLAEEPLPDGAHWLQRGHGHLAVLDYDTVREATDRRGAVLNFLESAYRAGGRLAGWDLDALSSPNGITDPVLLRHG